jgi:hypothetical protein
LVELGFDSILGDLFRLGTQVLGHSIHKGRFTPSPNLSSRASAVWDIHGRLGGLAFSVSGSGCCSLALRCLVDLQPRGRGLSARHELLSDSPRVVYGPSVFQGARLVVLLQLTNCPPVSSGPSARCPRTVRPCLANRPRGTVQGW